MKFFATLSALFLIVAAATEAAHHHHARHHHARHLQARAGEDKCEWKCLDAGGKEVEFMEADGPWGLEILGGYPGTGDLSFIYNPSGVFIVYNFAINIVVVFVSNTNFYAIANIETGAMLTVSYKMNYAKYSERPEFVDYFKNYDMVNGIQEIIYGVTDSLSFLLKANAINNVDIFNLMQVIRGGPNFPTPKPTPFKNKAALEAKVNKHFGPYLSTMHSRLAYDGIYDGTYNSLNSIVPVLGTIPAYQKIFRDAIGIQRPDGFNGDLAHLFRTLYMPSMYIGGYLTGELDQASIDPSSRDVTLRGASLSFEIDTSLGMANGNGNSGPTGIAFDNVNDLPDSSFNFKGGY